MGEKVVSTMARNYLSIDFIFMFLLLFTNIFNYFTVYLIDRATYMFSLHIIVFYLVPNSLRASLSWKSISGSSKPPF